jgi:hypothetical protein
MRMPRVRIRTLLALVVIVGLALGIYQAGYRAGRRDAEPTLLPIVRTIYVPPSEDDGQFTTRDLN